MFSLIIPISHPSISIHTYLLHPPLSSSSNQTIAILHPWLLFLVQRDSASAPARYCLACIVYVPYLYAATCIMIILHSSIELQLDQWLHFGACIVFRVNDFSFIHSLFASTCTAPRTCWTYGIWILQLHRRMMLLLVVVIFAKICEY